MKYRISHPVALEKKQRQDGWAKDLGLFEKYQDSRINYCQTIKLAQRSERMYPRYDPLPVFGGSKTPAGLYARQKWLGEEDSDDWRRDFSETVRQLRAGQSEDGSWDHSEIATIRRLFGLHLTVREGDIFVRRALEWLLSREKLWTFLWLPRRTPDDVDEDSSDVIDGTALRGLPFVNGCFGHLAVSAGLFLGNCFGLGESSMAKKLYETIGGEIESRGGRWCSIGCTSNALRAFVTNNRYSRSRATAMMVDYLGRRQCASGKWKGNTPFYLTLNALAHLDEERARNQCTEAMNVALRLQNKDGSWGRTEKEWNTFLVVHALNRLNARR